jgi:hypothetical protein
VANSERNDLANSAECAPGSISEFYLSTALEEADPDPRTISDLLDRIPGALEHAQGGVGEARSGLGTPLEDL